tara:strand:+ start:4026 stop:4340 length:315 start_codon:yes stop_codon:yes gene_type:complete
MNELTILCAAWCVSIYGAVQGIKKALRALGLSASTYKRVVLLLPLLVGMGSGFAMAPEVWARLGLETDMPVGAIILFGAGAGSSSSWVYGLVKHAVKKASKDGD